MDDLLITETIGEIWDWEDFVVPEPEVCDTDEQE